MMKNPFLTPLALFSAMLMVTACLQTAQALERSANGTTDLQSSWASIHTMANSAMALANTVDARVTNIVTCNLKAMAYAPGTGADADGCIENIKITQVSTSVDALNAQIDIINQKVATLNANVGNAANTISSIEGNVSAMNSQVSNLKATATDLTAKAADASTRLANLNAQLTSVRAQISDIQTRYDTHTAQIADLYSKIPGLNGSITNINSSISSLNSTVSYVNGVVAGLNGQLANVLNCGASNYIFNPNVGCVIPTAHTTCSLYQSGSYNSVTTCPAGQITQSTVSGQNCVSVGKSGISCTLTGTTRCYASTC